MVIIPKFGTYTQGIGMLEVMWKVVEGVIDTLVKSEVQFHDVLHGFHAGRGKGTTIMDLNISQDLKSMYQDPSLWYSLI